MLGVWRERKRDLDEMRPLLEKGFARLEEQKRRLVDAYVYEQAVDTEVDRYKTAVFEMENVVDRTGFEPLMPLNHGAT